ncbi:MAG: universal stress protein [Desulfobulbaceae bacterium]|nr:universal stress protein [Desulfobulbaceae bacterium]
MVDIKKILVAVDFSGNSDKLLQEAIYFAKKCDATIVIVFVLENFIKGREFYFPYILLPEKDEEELKRMPIPELESLMRQRAEEEMESLVKKNMEPAITCKTTLLIGEVAEEIAKYAEQEAIDLILMGTHGYKGFNELILGSEAHKVLRNAPCLVMTDNNRIPS